MTSTQVYQLYIRAEVETVFQALLDPEFTRRYFYGTAYTEPPRAGAPYLFALPDGSPAVDGTIEELDPPYRLVQTWHVRYDPAMAAEPPSRVEWTLTRAGEGLTRLRVVHGDLARSPLTAANVRSGWDWVLGGLKTLVETGMPLPPVDPAAEVGDGAGAAGEPTDLTGDWHRAQAIEANNATWAQLEAVAAGTASTVGLVRGAYAAAYHWERARGATPANEARARYLVGKAWLAYGRPELALEYGDRTLAQCREHGLADFDLAYAHELRARALAALGRQTESAAEWAAARSVPVADPEDRAIVEADFADADDPTPGPAAPSPAAAPAPSAGPAPAAAPTR
ncbi:MAG TPA: SRPBCC family protein [Dermatophilaceae bacterium]|nr:SRPBCC family protein [Dermatophilaceae bacterium]